MIGWFWVWKFCYSRLLYYTVVSYSAWLIIGPFIGGGVERKRAMQRCVSGICVSTATHIKLLRWTLNRGGGTGDAGFIKLSFLERNNATAQMVRARNVFLSAFLLIFSYLTAIVVNLPAVWYELLSPYRRNSSPQFKSMVRVFLRLCISFPIHTFFSVWNLFFW